MKRRLLIALLFVPLVLVIAAGVAHAAGISGKPARIGPAVEQYNYPPPDDPLPTEAAYPPPVPLEPTATVDLFWCNRTDGDCRTLIAPGKNDPGQ